MRAKTKAVASASLPLKSLHCIVRAPPASTAARACRTPIRKRNGKPPVSSFSSALRRPSTMNQQHITPTDELQSSQTETPNGSDGLSFGPKTRNALELTEAVSCKSTTNQAKSAHLTEAVSCKSTRGDRRLRRICLREIGEDSRAASDSTQKC